MLAVTGPWEKPSSVHPSTARSLLRPESHGWEILRFTKQLQVLLFTHHVIIPQVIAEQLGHPGRHRASKTWSQPWGGGGVGGGC